MQVTHKLFQTSNIRHQTSDFSHFLAEDSLTHIKMQKRVTGSNKAFKHDKQKTLETKQARRLKRSISF